MMKMRACIAVLSLFACVAIAVGRPPAARPAPPPKAPATPPVPRVVLTLNDGKSIAGEFVEATPAGITLRQGPKSDPVLTPWSSIKRASNGMTHAGIVDEWKKTKHELLCDTCEGAGATTCPTCQGTSVDPAQKQTCTKCEGTGSIGKCKTPNCVDGMIPCPDKCLKADSFTGPKDAEGKRWRQFRGKGGVVLKVSDFHVGQRVLMVDGVPQLVESPCPTCGGTTRVKDAACNGTGKTICPDCKGHGVTGPKCPTCEDGKVKCATCDGTGLKKPA